MNHQSVYGIASPFSPHACHCLFDSSHSSVCMCVCVHVCVCVKWGLTVLLMYISIMANDAEHLFVCLLVIWTPLQPAPPGRLHSPRLGLGERNVFMPVCIRLQWHLCCGELQMVGSGDSEMDHGSNATDSCCFYWNLVGCSSITHVRLFGTPWTAGHQAPLSFPVSQSLLKFMSIESVMPHNHLILCRPLLLWLSVFPSIRVFSNET